MTDGEGVAFDALADCFPATLEDRRDLEIAMNNTTQYPARRARRPLLPRLVLVSLVGAIGGFHLAGFAADSEPVDLDPNHQALVAREKIKQRGASRRTDARRGLQENGADANCGTVDIGNSTDDSRSARGRVNPRDTTVIVTGPVINAARCR
jgi:hypothetical protein